MRAILGLFSWLAFSITAAQDAPTPAKPVFEVQIDSALKGKVEIREKDVSAIVMSTLENAGISRGLTFTSRNAGQLAAQMSQRDRSGNYVFVPGGEHGKLSRPTHVVRLTYSLDRNYDSQRETAIVPIPIDQRSAGSRATTREERRYRSNETVVVRVAINVFDIVSGLSVAAVPGIEVEAKSELLRNDSTELTYRDALKIWILTIPIKVVEEGKYLATRQFPRGIQLTNHVIELATKQAVDQLASKEWKIDRRVSDPDFTPGLLSVDKKTVTIVGRVNLLKEGGLVQVPIMPTDRELAVGEASVATARVVSIGDGVATATFVNFETDAPVSLGDRLFIDARRPIVPLAAPKTDASDIILDSIAQDRESVVLSGNLRGLKVGSLLVIPLVGSRSGSDKTNVYVKVVRISSEIAIGRVWDVSRGAANGRISNDLVFDRTRKIKRG